MFYRSLGDDEDHHGGAVGYIAQPLVQPPHRFDEQVHALVAILITAAGHKINRVFQIEVVTGEKMPHHELVNLFLVLSMQILKFVQGGEALDVQAVGEDDFRPTAKQFFSFEAGDFADGGENRRCVGGGLFNLVARVDLIFLGFKVRVDEGQVIVKFRIVTRDVPAEQRGVRGENRGDRQPQVRDARYGHTAHPLVKVGENRPIGDKAGQKAEELGDGETERDHFVHFPVVAVDGDAVVGPHLVLVAVQLAETGAVVEQNHLRATGDHPAAKVAGHAVFAKLLQGLGDRALRFFRFKFHRGGLGIVRADETISVAPGAKRGGGLGSQDGVDSAELPAHFPGDFKKQRRLERGVGRFGRQAGRRGGNLRLGLSDGSGARNLHGGAGQRGHRAERGKDRRRFHHRPARIRRRRGKGARLGRRGQSGWFGDFQRFLIRLRFFNLRIAVGRHEETCDALWQIGPLRRS